MSDNLYVKTRGRVIGPFDEERLIQMVRQGQLSRASFVSTNGESWQKAGSIAALFKQERGPALSLEASRTEAELSQEWYYDISSESYGPVSAQTIQALIANGKIGHDETVWCEGMADWEPANTVNEFAKFFTTEKPRDDIELKTSSEQTKTKSNDPFEETTRLTTTSAPWVSFISVATFVFSAAVFFGSLFIFIKGAQAKSILLITNGVLGFVLVAIMIGGGVLLNRFAAGCKKFQFTSDPDDLNNALSWLNKFWVLAGIVMIMLVIFFVIAIIFSYATGATFA